MSRHACGLDRARMPSLWTLCLCIGMAWSQPGKAISGASAWARRRESAMDAPPMPHSSRLQGVDHAYQAVDAKRRSGDWRVGRGEQASGA
jgi:hypothetical protein